MNATTLPKPPPESRKNRSAKPNEATAYQVDWWSATIAAAFAAAAITIYMLTVPRLLGFEQMDIGITVGQMVDPTEDVLYLLTRVAWHVGNGLVYVFVYAAMLVSLQKQSSIATGVTFGVVLWLLGPMTLIPLLLDSFPTVASGELTNPGMFMQRLELGAAPALTDLGAHLLHGILTGVTYKHRLVRSTPSEEI